MEGILKQKGGFMGESVDITYEIQYNEIYKCFTHRNEYRIESGLLSIYCEYNNKNGHDFNMGPERILSLNNRQKFYYVEHNLNKYILVCGESGSAEIHL